jgi:hypothetical protein
MFELVAFVDGEEITLRSNGRSAGQDPRARLRRLPSCIACTRGTAIV